MKTDTITKKDIEDFIDTWGFTHDEAANLEEVVGGGSAESEMLINFGYVWVGSPYNKWLKKDHILYNEWDNTVLEHIRKVYSN